ncbi:MAG: hypothetical protein H6658_18175 [Ardenticatenaceae bacterium]|nr:hypothetical protein [Ardenticatenaceae bacterium]
MNEQQLQEISTTFRYPATPDLVVSVRRKLAKPRPVSQSAPRRLAWAVVILLALLAASLAVPQVRAAVLRIFKVGAITIIVPEEEEEKGATAVPTAAATPAANILLNPAGETTLAALQAQTDSPLYIPEGWGLPDRVYRQTSDWPGVVIFVWLKPDSADEVQLSLYQINSPNFVYKQAERLQEASVQGQPSFWLEGGHWLQLQNGTVQPWLFVEGGVLVWWSETADMTFRLESGLSLEEAKAIAESLVLLKE